MRSAAAIISGIAAFVLAGCEKKFDDKFDDNLKELTSEAEEIKAQADEQLTAGREAEKALEKSEEPPE